VKVAFVVGFYSPVEAALAQRFKGELDAGGVVFLGKASPHHAFDVKQFMAQFLHKADERDADPILVIAPDLSCDPKLQWVHYRLKEVIGSGGTRAGSRESRLVLCDDTQNSEPVVGALLEFGLGSVADSSTTVVPELSLQAYTKGSKVVCVRGAGQSTFEEALRRANFQFTRFEDYFDEVELSYSSNANNTVKKFAKRYGCLLYAWGVLKYLQPPIKKKWGSFHEGETPAAAVARFKQAVLGSAQDGPTQD
jgi:hypothetical protein